MALADARAICPALATRPADLTRQAAALAALRRWMSRYSPMVAQDGPDGITADITGVAHLFGGEEELRDDLQARLARSGITATSAIAGSRGGAHALARHGGGVIPEGCLARGLERLPIAALRVDGDMVAGLARLGLTRIGDLLPLPRGPLARRFGPELVMRLDQALDLRAEPVSPAPDAVHFGVWMALPEPIGLQSDVQAGLARLLERLCATLARHHRGARRVRLELQRVDHDVAHLEIGLARPMRDPGGIAMLFRKGLEDIDSGFGIDALRLSAPVTEPLAPEQIDGRAPRRNEDALADLVSRLGNRIGFDRVLRMQPVDSTIPERSFVLAPAAHSGPGARFPQGGPARPAILFPPEPVMVPAARPGQPPARFIWRRMRLSTLRATGPERIAPEWWTDDPAWHTGLRDYWRIETREGPRLWLFHTPQSQGRPASPEAQVFPAPGGTQSWPAPGGAQGWPVPARAETWFVQGEFA